MNVNIICTIGPSSWSEVMIRKMIEAGMEVARINASFADHAEIKRVKELVKSINPNVKVMLDLMGNKIRIAKLEEPRHVRSGDNITINCNPADNNPLHLHITYENLCKDIQVNAPILIEDGRIKLRVVSIEGNEIHSQVEIGGNIKKGKTLNVPGTTLTFDTLTPKDIADLLCGIECNVDLVAASFVRNAQDVLNVLHYIADKPIHIISKIENPQGVENFNEILEASYGIMVARGDLGVEMPLESIPIIQKRFIKVANLSQKYIIVATEILQSMVENPTPTRAEVSDIANAVIDGANALMLSAESSTGKYPVEAIQYMKRIINYTINATQ